MRTGLPLYYNALAMIMKDTSKLVQLVFSTLSEFCAFSQMRASDSSHDGIIVRFLNSIIILWPIDTPKDERS